MRIVDRLTTVRFGLILWATVVALGRLGILTVFSPTVIPKPVYGVAFAGAVVWLAATYSNGRRFGWSGRMAALWTAVLFFSLGIEVLPGWTSTLLLWSTALMAFLESITWREC